MTISWNDDVLACSGTLTVVDTETLLQEFDAHPGAALDLSGCAHLHAACLQAMMAAGVTVRAWPHDAALAAWLRAALSPQHSKETT